MNKYEILFILDNSLTDEKKQLLIDKFTGIVEQQKGKIVNIDKWGTKRFAYEINKKNEGYYFLINIEAEATVPQEIQRQITITEGAIRCMVIKKDEFAQPKRRPKKEFDKEYDKESKQEAKSETKITEKEAKSEEIKVSDKKIEEPEVTKSKEEMDYGSPVIDGVDPEFGKTTDNEDIRSDNPKE